ncbi:MAG: nitroreductase family protein [Lachnospiraceae bacterium]
MRFQDVLEERRSIRDYKEGMQISREQLEELIHAAMLAPSWKNSETARYYVVSSKELFEKIRTECLPDFNRDRTRAASAYIVVTYKKGISGFTDSNEAVNEIGDGWGCFDLGLATENLLLKAQDLGLGTLVMGIRDEKGLRSLLSIPKTENVMAVIAVGVANVHPPMPKRKPLEEVATFF